MFVTGMSVHNGALITNSPILHPDGTISTWSRWRPVCKQEPGDANGDGQVDVDDLIAVILSWGPCADCGDCSADFDGNCDVDVDDRITVILNWG